MVYLDDILVTDKSLKKHCQNLETVLTRLSQAGLRLKSSKRTFFKPEVQYLGHRIDKRGLYPNDDKVQAIQAAPAPQNVAELRSFLGLINYYGRFLPGLATTLSALYKLLHKGSPWQWKEEQRTAFQRAKEALLSTNLLVHFDPDRELVLACDASLQGVGAVLSDRYPDGSDKPIAFTSRTLNKTEKGYAKIDREALAVIFGIKRFHQFLCGRRFLIFTDHKPLVTLLGETKGVPTMCSGLIQRWAVLLSAYQYKLEYRPGIENANADALSRLPTSGSSSTADEDPPESVLSLHILEESATDRCQQLNCGSGRRDTVLARVRNYTLSGWPRGVPDGELRSYWNRRHELMLWVVACCGVLG